MAFPQTALPMKTEIFVNGAWTDITTKVLYRDSVSITRGRANESGEAEPTKCNLTLKNPTGDFSPRNPRGIYFGQIGRNTPLRHSVTLGTTRLLCPILGSAQQGATAPDTAALSITGDIDLRVEVQCDSWKPVAGNVIGKWTSTGNQRSYDIFIGGADGKIYLAWSPDGTTQIIKGSTVPLPYPMVGKKAVRATLDVNNGAAGNTVTFYYSSDNTITGTWIQLGDPVVTAGVTSIFNSTAVASVGGNGADLGRSACEILKAEFRNGIGGTVVASPDFTAQTSGVSSFVDAQGNTWTAVGGAEITARRARFVGEVPEWPVKWDISGTDVYAPISAAGITRRLGQGSSPLNSTYRRGYLRKTTPPVAYWPLEDGADSLSFSSAVGGPAMKWSLKKPDFGQDNTFPGSDTLPNFNGASLQGLVKGYTSTASIQTRFLLHVPDAGTVNNAIVARVKCTGTAPRWDLVYQTGSGGVFVLNAYDGTDTLISQVMGPTIFDLDGLPNLISIELKQNGTGVDWTVSGLQVGQSSGGFVSGTLASRSVGRATQILLNPAGSMLDVGIGHVTVESAITSLFDMSSQLNAYLGETAGTRFERICSEEGIPNLRIGDIGTTARMGYQKVKSALELLRECAAADDGMVIETREALGLALRPGKSQAAQNASVTLDYSLGHLNGELNPVDDDQNIANDVTATRDGAGSARYTLDTGKLSTAAPPSGVGRYDTQNTYSIAYDDIVQDRAAWDVHKGTVDETRYPLISVLLENARIAASTTLTLGLIDTDIGDRINVTNPPIWLPPETIDQIVQGFTETMNQYHWGIDFNCSPESVWQLGLANDSRGVSRWFSPGTIAATTSGATTFTVTTTLPHPPWATSGIFPFDVMLSTGERVRVNSITNAASPQIFGVTRAINGIVKAVPALTTFTFIEPSYYAI